MKYLLPMIMLLLLSAGLLHAQSLDGFTLIAHYPLQENADDALGAYDPMTLVNTPFQDGGIYCNGNYTGSEPDSSDAGTPFLAGLSMKKFAISARFKVTEDYEKYRPILIGGPSWRWMAISLDVNLAIGLAFNDIYAYSNDGNPVISKDTWHTVTVIYDSVKAEGLLYLDGVLADSVSTPLDHANDKALTITHGGDGVTFKGFLADLKIYNGSDASLVEDEKALPTAFVLQQNFPNPFNPTTTINFSIRESGEYDLAVYNTSGQRIKTLLRENLTSQSYSITFGAADLPSGVYIYRLQGRGESQARRFVVLK